MTLAAILLLASVPLPPVEDSVSLSVPEIGTVQCFGHATGTPPFERPLVRCLNEGRHPLLRVGFSQEFMTRPSHVRLKTVSVRGLPDPLLVAVAAAPGNPDALFETTLIAARGGVLMQVLPGHLRTNGQEALCLTVLGGDHGILQLKSTQGHGRGASRYGAHRWRANFYRWTGVDFAGPRVLTTAGRAATWEEAAAELGVACDDVLRSVPGLDAFR